MLCYGMFFSRKSHFRSSMKNKESAANLKGERANNPLHKHVYLFIIHYDKCPFEKKRLCLYHTL